jgi:hypothetical protein
MYVDLLKTDEISEVMIYQKTGQENFRMYVDMYLNICIVGKETYSGQDQSK